MGGRPRLVRLLVAIAVVTFLSAVALVVGAGKNASHQRQAVQAPDAVTGIPAGHAVSAKSPAHAWSVAQPHRVPPLRSLRSAPYKHMPEAPEPETPTAFSIGQQFDGALQTTARHNLMPSPL